MGLCVNGGILQPSNNSRHQGENQEFLAYTNFGQAHIHIAHRAQPIGFYMVSLYLTYVPMVLFGWHVSFKTPCDSSIPAHGNTSLSTT